MSSLVLRGWSIRGRVASHHHHREKTHCTGTCLWLYHSAIDSDIWHTVSFAPWKPRDCRAQKQHNRFLFYSNAFLCILLTQTTAYTYNIIFLSFLKAVQILQSINASCVEVLTSNHDSIFGKNTVWQCPLLSIVIKECKVTILLSFH